MTNERLFWACLWLFCIFVNTCSINTKLESIRSNLEKIEQKVNVPKNSPASSLPNPSVPVVPNTVQYYSL